MYHAPTDLSDALRTLSEEGGKVIAGGTDVYPAAQQGQTPDSFLDVTRIAALGGVSQCNDGIRIGAAATWTQVINTDLPPAFDGLKQAAREVGSVQIQNAGTIAGNLCNASPAADGVPPLLALDASVELESKQRGSRRLLLSEFITGVRGTELADDELMTAIVIPMSSSGMGSAFEKLGSRRYLVISITMTAALVSLDTSGKINEARIAVGACSPVAQRLPELEESLLGQSPETVTIDPTFLSQLAPIDDVRGSKDFRFDVVNEQIARAIKRAGQA